MANRPTCFVFGNAWWVWPGFLGMQIIKGGLWLCSEDTEHGYKLTSAVSSIN